MRYDTIIIGGGPAGATVAILLARAGWSVAVVEKSSFPRSKVCGEYISATNALVLDELGIGDRFRALAGPEVRRVGVFAGDAVLASAMPQAREAAGGWGSALGRETLDLLLLERAAQEGAQLWQPWSAIELRGGGDGFLCRIAARGAERDLQARIVIAAHGSWERGTLPTQPARRHRDSDLLAFKAHFSESDLPADLMPLLAFPGGYGGMAHSDGGRVSLSCCIRRDALEECRRRHANSHAAEAVFHHILESCAGVRQHMRHARLDGRWLSAGPINPGIRRRYAHGIFRVGNAAGEAHPIVAEGISMAMQSGHLLARHLLAAQNDLGAERALVQAGSGYSADWRRCFATRIRAAAMFAHLAMRPASVAVLRPVLERFPGVLTLGARLSGKTRLIDVVPLSKAAHLHAPVS